MVRDALVRHWKAAAVISAGLLLEMGFNALVPFSFKFIVDDGLMGGDHSVLLGIVGGLAAGAIVVSLTGLWRDYLYARVVTEVLAELRARIFAHLQRLSLDFHGSVRPAEILTRFSGDLAVVETALAGAVSWGILPTLAVFANTVLLFILDWRLALVSMLVWPLALLGPRVFAPRAVQASYERKREEGETLAGVQENLSLQRVVKALSLEEREERRFGHLNQRLSRSVLKVSYFGAMVERSAGVGIMLLQVTVLGVGAWMASRDLMTVGTLASFQALFMSLSASLTEATQFVPPLVEAAGGMKRIEEILAEEPSVADAPDAEALPRLSGSLTLEDVTFGYGDGDPVLTGVDLTVAAGTSVALVGTNGSGRSTVLGLLLRLQEPREGRVLLDGHDLRGGTVASLRGQMGTVFSDSLLFEATVADNIRMGKLDATPEEVEKAARDAGIHEDIQALPQGFGTLVGGGRDQLTGDQRQRVALARALVRNPRVLLLDEIAASLDPEAEEALNATLDQVSRDRTVVRVTHRLASVADADRIFMLDGGRVAEEGSHAELVSGDGPYSRIWAKQSGFSVSAGGKRASVTAERLHAMPVLDQLDEGLLAEAARLFATETYAGGRTVVYQGDPGDRFYIIARGSVEVVRTGDDGTEVVLGVLQDGDSFGEMALLRDAPRNADVRTLTPCTFLTLGREPFDYLLDKSPELRQRLEQLQADREGPR